MYTPTVIHLNDLAGEDTELVVDKLTNINIQVTKNWKLDIKPKKSVILTKSLIKKKHTSLEFLISRLSYCPGIWR